MKDITQKKEVKSKEAKLKRVYFFVIWQGKLSDKSIINNQYIRY